MTEARQETTDRGRPPDGELLCFDGFELESRTGELRHDGEKVALQPQPALVLQQLAERAGELVTRSDLQQLVWGADRSVDSEHGLNYCVLQIRKALGDDADDPVYLETIPRRGYRFLRPVIRKPLAGRVHGHARRRSRRSGRIVTAGIVTALVLAAGVFFAGGEERGTRRSLRLVVEPIRPAATGLAAGAERLGEELVSQLVMRLQDGVTVVANGERAAADSGLAPDLVLEGSLRRIDGRFEASLRLLDPSEETTLWAGSFEAAAGLDGWSDCAERIVEAIAPRFRSLARPPA